MTGIVDNVPQSSPTGERFLIDSVSFHVVAVVVVVSCCWPFNLKRGLGMMMVTTGWAQVYKMARIEGHLININIDM